MVNKRYEMFIKKALLINTQNYSKQVEILSSKITVLVWVRAFESYLSSSESDNDECG